MDLMRGLLRGRDVAVMYGGVVAALCLVLTLASSEASETFVQATSTNLVNLHQNPLEVLLLSAFVEPSLTGLWILVPLLWACSVLQRWLGRLPTLMVLTIGHVGATLLVATVLTAGITHGHIAHSIAHAHDVGVSYAVVTAAGLLCLSVPRRYFLWYLIGLTSYFAMRLLIGGTFTDLGHITAWLIGLSLALIVRAANPGPRTTTTPRDDVKRRGG